MSQTLYDRLGGESGLRAAVDLLFGKALRDERLRYSPATRRSSRRAPAWVKAALSSRRPSAALGRLARNRFDTKQRRALLELWEETLLELGQSPLLARASRAALHLAS
jgi:truncated hemoglobin YjbI